MKYLWRQIPNYLLLMLATCILISCNAKPYDYQPTANEMKEGGGLFTGEDGEATIYDSEAGGGFWEKDKEKPAEASAPDTTAATAAAAGTTAVPESKITPEEAEEFQQFQEWKKEKTEFKEYQEWKNSSNGSADYQEFQEWKEWKEYQQWKKKQGN